MIPLATEQRQRISVDWDGTCVEHKWPEMGDWLPGAVAALRALDANFDVVIFSCRVAGFEFPAAASHSKDVARHPADVGDEIYGIYQMLHEADLGHLEIWTRPYKPPAFAYIDDRNVPFSGDWGEALAIVYVTAMREVTA